MSGVTNSLTEISTEENCLSGRSPLTTDNASIFSLMNPKELIAFSEWIQATFMFFYTFH